MNNKRSIITFSVVVLAAVLALGGCALFAPTGTVTGTVIDSTAGDVALTGVAVSVLDASYTATTDSSGDFSITAPEGTVTLHFVKSGYTFTDVVVVVVADQTTAVSTRIVAYHVLTSGQYRFVLTWGATPSDLDSHLLVPVGAGEDVYYGNQLASDNSANLDVDDTSSYGPETITITTVDSGAYSYSVFNYSGSPDMGANSSAVVQVFDTTGLVNTLSITAAPGSSTSTADWWHVFTFNGTTRTFTWVNAMSTTGP